MPATEGERNTTPHGWGARMHSSSFNEGQTMNAFCLAFLLFVAGGPHEVDSKEFIQSYSHAKTMVRLTDGIEPLNTTWRVRSAALRHRLLQWDKVDSR